MNRTVKHKLVTIIDSLVTSTTIDDLCIPEAYLNQLKNKQGVPKMLLLKDGNTLIISPSLEMNFNFAFRRTSRAIKDARNKLGLPELDCTHNFTISNGEKGTLCIGMIYSDLSVTMLTERSDEQISSHCEELP
jgi:hypothetical protein